MGAGPRSFGEDGGCGGAACPMCADVGGWDPRRLLRAVLPAGTIALAAPIPKAQEAGRTPREADDGRQPILQARGAPRKDRIGFADSPRFLYKQSL